MGKPTQHHRTQPVSKQEPSDFYYHELHLPYENVKGEACDMENCFHRTGETTEFENADHDTVGILYHNEAENIVEVVDVTAGVHHIFNFGV